MKNSRENSHNHNSIKKSSILWMVLLLALVCAAGCAFGSKSFSLQQLWDGLAGKEETATVILYHLRIPRVLAALLAGMGLSVAGLLLQSVTANEMASPNIIGVNSGAGFCCMLLLNFFPLASQWLPLAAFLGAFAATLLITGLSVGMGASKNTVILAGIACTSVLNAGISLLSLLDTDILAVYNAFSVGSLSGVRISQLVIPFVIIMAGMLTALLFARRIQLLTLGDDIAYGLGANVLWLRILCLLCASACAAAVVSFAGLLGFVGLVVPHMARKLGGNMMRGQLVVSVILGGALVVSADLLGRILLAPTEIPVGIVMALIGAPFFVWLLLRRRGRYAEV